MSTMTSWCVKCSNSVHQAYEVRQGRAEQGGGRAEAGSQIRRLQDHHKSAAEFQKSGVEKNTQAGLQVADGGGGD
tara:strand:+ start:463 stop:687 length:225 start_codon:yes stop_codon:yes gene_type:complete